VPETPAPVRTRVTRRITADPTSTALLLAGPTALDLWPGVRRVGESDGRLLVEAEVAEGPSQPERRPTSATVRALPPRRTPTAYVTRFGWSGPELPGTSGQLTLAYAPTGDGTPVTHAVLTLDSTGLEDSRLDQLTLATMAEGFLANLARAAEARSRAA
jgi:hypothetical protein